MKRETVKLLFWTALAYIVFLIILRGAYPSNSTPAASLIAIPLLISAIILIRDMLLRSTNFEEIVDKKSLEKSRSRRVEFLSRQIDVTAKASRSYFDDVVRARLRELLISKVSLESGLDLEQARHEMREEEKAMRFLKNEALYKLLYSPIPEKGRARIVMIRDAVDLIEAWNP